MAHNWLNKAEYPFQSRYFDVDGHKLHYIDEGSGETILFVHGTPSWSFEYRNIIKELRRSYRCVAIDHIGFGLSDKPEDYDYATVHHSKVLEKFILENQLENIILVVHDFGGPIALNFAIQYPQKIKGLVILNSWLWSSKSDPDFNKMSKMLRSPLLPFLYRYFNFSAKYLLPRSFGKNKLPRHLLEHYTEPFADRSERNGVIAFAKSLLNDQDWFEELWKKKRATSDKPTLFVWGMEDPIIKPAYLNKFRSGFIHSHALKLETSGHFPHEERPEIVSGAIATFLNELSIPLGGRMQI